MVAASPRRHWKAACPWAGMPRTTHRLEAGVTIGDAKISYKTPPKRYHWFPSVSLLDSATRKYAVLAPSGASTVTENLASFAVRE